MEKAWLIAVGACVYQPGSFADVQGGFGGTRVRMGCLELAVGPATDPNVPGPIIAYDFGNRCEHAIDLDLASVHVIGRDTKGVDHELVANDPNHEIRVATLDARWMGREQIQYRGQSPATLVSVCVDVGGANASIARSERWICGAP